MMKVLVINGSPKGKNSNTYKLTTAFIQGLKHNQDIELKEYHLSSMNLHNCAGCFSCWNKTPGKCIYQDDMYKIIEDEVLADIIIYSFPLYYFNVPAILKNMIDRQLPMNLPFMNEDSSKVGSGSHPSRYDMSNKRYVLISTCGFYSSTNNYDSVLKMFDHICGYQNYETIFCGQGELFRVQELSHRTNQYLEIVEKAGQEYLKDKISNQTKEELSKLLFPKEQFEAMADASWGIDKETGQKQDEHEIFTRQMAGLYNPSSYDGKDRVLEICYVDVQKTYQILLTQNKSEVYKDGTLTPTTRIETPYDIWLSIARDEIHGAEALARGMYKVSGDLDLMMHWGDYFGSKQENSNQKSTKQSNNHPVMTTMLMAWISFWVCVSIDKTYGPIISLAICSAIPLIMTSKTINFYDRLSLCTVSILSILLLLQFNTNMILVLSYLLFGLMWFISSLTKEPVCASYVKYSFGGDNALNNPIFTKTNKILSMAWGILYMCIACWTYFILKSNHILLLQLLNNGSTIIMAIFTAWFQNWYPKHIMSGK